jgi:diadenylate cyclase
MDWPIINLSRDWWRIGLEIVLLAVGIYYALMFVRGTRGWSVVLGFLLMMAVTLITYELHLRVVNLLLERFFAFSAFAILVIFQPELRRMLSELGNLPWLYTAHEQRENIEVIIQSVERLAEVKIGALIALEQAIPLHNVVESGVVVDCEATPEMLETIFFPNNAIHDGGVIIRGDRIAYAACIFPLTQRQDLNKSLGTRHRAAIGLSEETDALVVVVSEETGAVSYAHKGQFTRAVSREELRAFLTAELVKRRKSDSVLDWLRKLWRPRAAAAAPPQAAAEPAAPVTAVQKADPK